MSRIILVGPTASGKNFIREKFIQKGFKADVSYTSREKRPIETDGLDYKFVSKAKFEEMIANGKFYEYVPYGEDYYGTGLREFYGNDIFIMETDGVKKIKMSDRRDSVIIYVDTPMEIRLNRMKNERNWDQETIDKRLKIDAERFENFTDFDLKIQS